jgi:hypothetical protein
MAIPVYAISGPPRNRTWIVPKNLWRNAALTPSSENPEFPADSTRDDSPQLFWRSVAGALTPTIIGDLGSALPYNFISIRGHNLTGASTITVEGADDAAISVNVLADTIDYYGNAIYQALPATRIRRYARFSFSDSANPSNYINVANIIVGLALNLGRQFTIGSSRGYIDESEIQQTPSGVDLLVQAHAMPETQIYKWTGLTDAAASYVRSLQLECGIKRAFILCLDSTSPNTNSYWVKTPTLNPLLRDGPNNHTWEPGELREVL